MLSNQFLAAQSQEPQSEQRSRPTPPPPTLPQGFTALGEARPLFGYNDEWWAVFAHGQDYDVNSLLVFANEQEIAFFTPGEAVTFGTFVMQYLPDLLQQCPAEYVQHHIEGIDALRDAWWSAAAAQTGEQAPMLVHQPQEGGQQ